MLFVVPGAAREFEIPDQWWDFCEMRAWQRQSEYFPYAPDENDEIQIIELGAIEPPARSPGVTMFKKYKLVPVLLAFRSPECQLPPVVLSKPQTGEGRLQLRNGFHRFYASIAVGYTHVPAKVLEAWYEA
jgi:hypothetical protein